MGNNELKEENKGKLYFTLIALLLIVLLVIGISVVTVTFSKKGDRVKIIFTISFNNFIFKFFFHKKISALFKKII